MLTVCARDIQAKRSRTKLQLIGRRLNQSVKGDSARLHQSLWNLMKNAVKFTPEHGSIAHADHEWPEGSHMRIEVEDSGIGIPAEVLPKIFDAVRTGGGGRSRQFGGLGLGLAISRASHGECTAER